MNVFLGMLPDISNITVVVVSNWQHSKTSVFVARLVMVESAVDTFSVPSTHGVTALRAAFHPPHGH